MLVPLLESVALRLLPSGGQRGARRNAWRAMSSDAVHARARRDAAVAMERAGTVTRARDAHPSSRQAVAAR